MLSMTVSFAQVQVGDGADQTRNVPFEPFYGYSYAQSIYLASEINASGTITSFQWYFSGTSALPNSQELVVYFGHSSRSEYADSADFEDVGNLTQVYSGGIDVSAGPGWVTVTLDTPFDYNGTDNLIIAVDENLADYDTSADDFYNSAVATNRSIWAFSDGTNTDPFNPNDDQGGFLTRGIGAFVPNIIFDGIQQACPNPTQVAFSNVTISGADFSWTVNGTETAWEVLVQEDGAEAPSNDTAGTPVTANPTYTSNSGDAGTNYDFYVRANCGSGFSSWVGPLSFFTQCLPFDDFTEDFNATALDTVPECWSRIAATTSAFAYVEVVGFGAASAPNALELYNSDDANANLMLVTPNLTSLPADTHRLKFSAVGGNGYSVIVGTLSDPTDPETFTEVETVAISGTYGTYTVVFANGTTDNFIAIKHGLGGTFRTIRIDDVIWEPIPTAPPVCSEDVAATTNEACGNFATTFSWTAVEGADGYNFSLGTSAGSNDIVDGVDLATALTYSFAGDANSTYYFTLTPYNDFGTASGCVEQSFTTFTDGCYCTSVPTSNDALGITNIQIGATDFANEDVTYTDFTAEQIDLAQGLNCNVQISFATGYTYNTYIWIDFDDNLTFSEEEIVYTGASLAPNPTVLDASFVMPGDATLGAHRMRVVTADFLETANPCYSGTYGVTLDFSVNIVEATCTPPSVASATVSPDCDNNQYFIDVEVVDLGSGAPVIFDGTTEYPVAAAGTIQVGPYENLSSVTLIITHGTDAVCDLPIGTFSYVCPPNCDNAVVIENCGDAIVANIVAGPGAWNPFSCNFNTPGIELLYSFTPTVTGLYSLQVTAASGGYIDYFYKEATGTCDETGWICIDDLSFTTTVPIAELQAGVTYLFLLDPEGTSARSATFNIECAPTCTDATVNYAIVSDCANGEQFFVDVNVTDVGTAESLTVSDDQGSATQVLTAAGTVQFGPFQNGTPIVFTVANDQDATCVLTSATQTQLACPPANDNCEFATPMTITGDFATSAIAFDTTGATVNANNPLPSCGAINVNTNGKDIWYQSIAPESGSVTVETQGNGGLTDTVISVYTGSCDALVEAGCDDDGGTGSFSLKAFTGLTAGEPLYIRVRGYNGSQGTALLGCYDASLLGTDTFNNASFTYYPNPVKEVLNLSYSQNISDVAVFNLLGQQVVTKSVNASQTKIDMSNLATGTYIVKVTANNVVKTIKVVKE